MQEIDAPPLAPLGGDAPAPGSRLDFALSLSTWLLVLAIVAVSAWFGYTIWATRSAENLSTPAMRAIAVMKQQVKKTPNNADLRVRLGEALATAGLTDDALKQFGDAIKINAKHDGAYLDMGLVSAQKKDAKTAEACFKKVVELTEGTQYEAVNQRRETALFYLGELMSNERRYEDAVSYFKAALRIRRDSADSYFNLAMAYKGLHEDDQALKQLEIAVNFDTDYAQAWYEMGQVYAARKDYINASYDLMRASKADPDADQPKEALAALGSAGEWRAKAESALKAGNTKAALDAVLVARNLDASDTALAKLHGQIAEKKGDRKAALAVWKEAAKLSPKDPDIKAALARLSK